MDFANLTPTDWSDCFKKYPHVQDFLLERALRNEYQYLTHELDALERMRAQIFASSNAPKTTLAIWNASTPAKRLTWVAQRVAELKANCPWVTLQGEDYVETQARQEWERTK